MKIITHPANKHLLTESFIKEEYIKKFGNCIHIPGIHIQYNEYLEIDKHAGWKRTNKMPDLFCTMVEDLDNPPDWAIYFGLVEEIREPVFYVMDNITYMNHGISYVPKTSIIWNSV